MPLRLIRHKLRDIDRHSRRVERGPIDRIQGAAFVVAVFLAPFLVWKMESWWIRRDVETVALVAVYKGLSGEGMAGAPVRDPSVAIKFPAASIPLAEVRIVRDHAWHGWPLVTLDTISAPRLEATLLPTCPDARRAEACAVAERVFERENPGAMAPTTARTDTHVGGWIFSIGAWWVMLTALVWAVLAPIRVALRLRRTVRNAVRQGRIDRCHCPNCGYNARESITTGRCPECGGDLYERPDW